MDAAVAAHDAGGAYAALFADDFEAVHHLTGVTYDRRAALAYSQRLLDADDLTYRHERLATLGDSLALCRLSWSGSGAADGEFDIGPYEGETILLIEVNAQGRRRLSEHFAADRLRDACYRLYERYAELLPAGPERERAAAIARTHASVLQPLNAEAFAAMIAPTFEMVDHRTLGFAAEHGAEAFLRGRARSLLETAQNVSARIDDVLGLRCDALLTRGVIQGIDRSSGGEFELPSLDLTLFGDDGLITRIEQFDIDHEAKALARFDELVGNVDELPINPSESPLGKGRTEEGSRQVPRIENAATRSNDRVGDAWAAHDWARVAAEFAHDFRLHDHRSYAHLDLDRDQHLDSLHMRFQMHSSRMTTEILATRGDRLALGRVRFELADGDVGPSESEALWTCEVDEQGKRVTMVAFNADDLDAAYAELDERYAAGEGASHARTTEMIRRFQQIIAARDWEQLASVLAADLVIEDHRPLGWGTLHGLATYVETLRSLVDLAPDARLRLDHIAASDRAALTVGMWVGTYEGGAFEAPRVAVWELGRLGRFSHFDTYNPDQLDEARARFAELRPDPTRIPPNAATRVRDRAFTAFEADDWPAQRALTRADFTYDDRRKRSLLSGAVELWIKNMEFMRSTPGTRITRELIGTVGDRLALERLMWTGGPDGGMFENEFLLLTETNADGQLTASMTFDLDDRRAAFAEAQARFVAREAAAIGGQAPIVVLVRAFARHDWETLRGCLADDFVLRDHRTLGLLGALRPDEWVESLRVQADLAPDVDVETLRIITWNRHGRVEVSRVFGTLRDGGPYENVFLRVMLTNGDRIQHFELFNVGDADRALARFAELCADLA